MLQLENTQLFADATAAAFVLAGFRAAARPVIHGFEVACVHIGVRGRVPPDNGLELIHDVHGCRHLVWTDQAAAPPPLGISDPGPLAVQHVINILPERTVEVREAQLLGQDLPVLDQVKRLLREIFERW